MTAGPRGPTAGPPAGRELDALVAEHVMGWTVNRADGRHWHTVGPTGRERGILIGRYCCQDKYDGAFCPSTDIAAAWEVVEKLQSEWAATIENDGAGWWEATFWAGDTRHTMAAGAAPLAICWAGLLAVGDVSSVQP